jgi:ArsR family transcriptional regulator
MSGVAEQTARTDRLFKALASSVRREIIATLSARTDSGGDGCCPEELCACTFSEQLGLGAPTVSHHMKVLQDAGLVEGEKRGLWVYYRLAPRALADVADAVGALGRGVVPEAAVEPASACCGDASASGSSSGT